MVIEIGSTPPKRHRGRLFFGVSILIVFLAITTDYWEKKRVQNLRTLSLEEQETVFAVLDRAAIQYRLSKERIKTLRSRINNPAFPPFVDTGMGHKLLSEENEVLLFSPRFFEADTVAQEKSLVPLAID